MELYYTLAVLDRGREKAFQDICRELKISVVLATLGRGTATKSHLQLHDLEPTEKVVLCTLASAASMKLLLRAAKRKMYIDIPGNGIMLAIPVKSVSGKKTLEYFTANQNVGGTKPVMEFKNELIVVILNEGYSDMVMDAAREAGATGGTILHAKGSGAKGAARFFGMSVVEEKDIIYILAASDKKSQIMKAINNTCGTNTKAAAVCFSLPVSETVGLRRLTEEEV